MRRLRVVTGDGIRLATRIKNRPESIYAIDSELAKNITIAAEGGHYFISEGSRAVLIDRELMRELHDVYEEVEYVANMGMIPGRGKR